MLLQRWNNIEQINIKVAYLETVRSIVITWTQREVIFLVSKNHKG